MTTPLPRKSTRTRPMLTWQDHTRIPSTTYTSDRRTLPLKRMAGHRQLLVLQCRSFSFFNRFSCRILGPQKVPRHFMRMTTSSPTTFYRNAAQADWAGPHEHSIDHIHIESSYTPFEEHDGTSTATCATLPHLFVFQ